MRSMISVLLAVTLATAPAAAATRGFPVSGFDRVRSSVPFDVRVHTGAAPSVHAEGPREAIDRLRIEVRGGELVIGTVPGGWFSGWHMGRERAVIDVTVPMISGLALSGPGNLDVDRVRTRGFTASLSGPGNLGIGMIEAEHVDLALSGPGDLTVAGRAGSARVALSGPGDVRAARLAVRDATVALSGPGDIALTASGLVQGTLSGPGDITISGGARCAITKHGPGDVHCR